MVAEEPPFRQPGSPLQRGFGKQCHFIPAARQYRKQPYSRWGLHSRREQYRQTTGLQLRAPGIQQPDRNSSLGRIPRRRAQPEPDSGLFRCLCGACLWSAEVTGFDTRFARRVMEPAFQPDFQRRSGGSNPPNQVAAKKSPFRFRNGLAYRLMKFFMATRNRGCHLAQPQPCSPAQSLSATPAEW